jgi:valine--pyruvate aminotransferase
MTDLGEAAGTARGPTHMLGGGNPARIAEVEALYRRRLAEIAADGAQFGRFAAVYSAPSGEMAFRAELAAFLADRYGWRLTERNIALTAGSQAAFFAIYNLLAGDREDGSRRRIVLPLAPEYIGYSDLGLCEDMIVAQRAAIEELPGGFFKYHVDFDGLEHVGNVAAFCVSRPTNPSGNVLTSREIERLDALARARGVPLIIDAAYGRPFPGIQFDESDAEWNDNVVLCLSLSKLGLPATRTGIVVAREALVEALTAWNATCGLAPPSTGAVIVEPLLRSGELAALRDEVIRPYYAARSRQALEWLQEAFRDLPLRIHRPEGTFFLWLWFPGLPLTSHELYRRLKARGVLVLSGHHFFPGLAGEWRHRDECLRINYAQAPESVLAGIRAIAAEVRRALDERRR